MRTRYHAIALELCFGADVDQDRSANHGVARLLGPESSQSAASRSEQLVDRGARRVACHRRVSLCHRNRKRSGGATRRPGGSGQEPHGGLRLSFSALACPDGQTYAEILTLAPHRRSIAVWPRERLRGAPQFEAPPVQQRGLPRQPPVRRARSLTTTAMAVSRSHPSRFPV